MLTYEHTNFKLEKCGWCDNDAIPRVKDVNGQLQLYYYKYLCDNKKCCENRKKVNPRSYEHAKKTYKLSDIAANKKVRKASPFHREYYNSDKAYNEFQAQCSLRSFIDRFGQEQGKIKFNEYRKLRSFLASEQHFIDELGEEAGKIKYEEIRKKKAITRDNLREKYGIKEGDKRYESFLDKTLKNFVSQESIDFFNLLSNTFLISIKYGRNNEKKIVCEKGTHPVDGYCEQFNIAIEYFGDKWHLNPKLFNKNDVNAKRKPAVKVWTDDKERLDDILSKVKAVFVCWGHDWKYNRQQVFDHFSNLLNQLKQDNLQKKIYYLGEQT
jgi:hypothetical protein